MKTRALVLALCVGGYFAPAFQANADFEVSAGVTIRSRDDFYEPLSGRGTWVEVGHYGRCWRPVGVVAGWRPYCHGYWVWTDCGWYWESDEPWAWACYHYGTWVFDPGFGWVWVPGTEWAPAWVYWRTGPNYIGWAPCGPSGFVVEPSLFVFVQSRHFHDRIQPDRVIVNNTTIINQTTEIRNAHRERREINHRPQTVIVNDGPSVATVSKATGHKYSATPVEKADRTTIRSVPEKLKQRSNNEPRTEPRAEPRPESKTMPQKQPNPVQPNGKTQKPAHNQNEEPFQAQPNNIEPREKVVPPAKTTPHILPREQIVPPAEPAAPPSERVLPQTPPERVTPRIPAERITPEHPKEMLPPSQPQHPPAQVAPPANQPPFEKGQPPGRGRDREKDRPDM